MKYLAAYALLALSGKTNISTQALIQPPRTLKLFSTASNLTLLTRNSTESWMLCRERAYTSSLPKEQKGLAPVLLLLLLQERLRRRRSRLLKNSNPRRRKNRRRRKNQRLRRLTRIWEICSADVIALFNWQCLKSI